MAVCERFSCDEDHVECAVEFSVAASVEAVADGLAGGGGDRCCAGEPRKRCFGGDPSLVACDPIPGWSSSCGASLRVIVSISVASRLAKNGVDSPYGEPYGKDP